MWTLPEEEAAVLPDPIEAGIDMLDMLHYEAQL